MKLIESHCAIFLLFCLSANDNKVRMISCGADKSIYFQTAHKVRHV